VKTVWWNVAKIAGALVLFLIGWWGFEAGPFEATYWGVVVVSLLTSV